MNRTWQKQHPKPLSTSMRPALHFSRPHSSWTSREGVATIAGGPLVRPCSALSPFAGITGGSHEDVDAGTARQSSHPSLLFPLLLTVLWMQAIAVRPLSLESRPGSHLFGWVVLKSVGTYPGYLHNLPITFESRPIDALARVAQIRIYSTNLLQHKPCNFAADIENEANQSIARTCWPPQLPPTAKFLPTRTIPYRCKQKILQDRVRMTG